MFKKKCPLVVPIGTLLLIIATSLNAKKGDKEETGAAEITMRAQPVLWREPTDIASRNLFYGPGGREHEPHGTFTFTKEDLDGTSPKFFIRDQDGVKWKVKLGSEARSETAASRLVWAAGYYANENYFVSDLKVLNMPLHLHRGQRMVARDGTVHNVRLKRYLKTEEKSGTWPWRQAPFGGPHEFNGLRVLMALINNWDLTDDNNAFYEEQVGAHEQVYMVTDLGSTFGPGRLTWPLAKSRGNLSAYRNAKFIIKTTPGYVDFQTPTRPSFFFLFTPREYNHKLRLMWIGRDIPRSDARWIGQILAQLSPQQIRDAFRAAGYSAPEIEGFAQVVSSRISQLQQL